MYKWCLIKKLKCYNQWYLPTVTAKKKVNILQVWNIVKIALIKRPAKYCNKSLMATIKKSVQIDCSFPWIKLYYYSLPMIRTIIILPVTKETLKTCGLGKP